MRDPSDCAFLLREVLLFEDKITPLYVGRVNRMILPRAFFFGGYDLPAP